MQNILKRSFDWFVNAWYVRVLIFIVVVIGTVFKDFPTTLGKVGMVSALVLATFGMISGIIRRFLSQSLAERVLEVEITFKENTPQKDRVAFRRGLERLLKEYYPGVSLVFDLTRFREDETVEGRLKSLGRAERALAFNSALLSLARRCGARIISTNDNADN